MTTEPRTPEHNTIPQSEQTRTHILELSFDKPPLTLNFRGHWAEKARLTKQIRTEVHLRARAANLPRGLDHIIITLHYQPRDNRRRDPSNLMLTQKSCLDGLVDYGLVPDDNPTYVEEHMPKIHPVDKTPRRSRLWLEITVEEVVA